MVQFTVLCQPHLSANNTEQTSITIKIILRHSVARPKKSQPLSFVAMSNTAAIVICSVAAFESLVILIANSFTVFVFWTHRNKLKRTSFLLINLAVADLLIGFTEPIAIGTVAISQRFEEQNYNGNISTAFQATFASASVFCLVLISLERAFALIWPFRHRTTSTGTYICAVAIVWAAGTTVGMLSLLAVFSIVNFVNWIVAYYCIIALSLLIVCASYLSIRRKLTRRLNPAMDTAHNGNRQSPEEHNAIKTLQNSVYHDSCVTWVLASKHCAFFCSCLV